LISRVVLAIRPYCQQTTNCFLNRERVQQRDFAAPAVAEIDHAEFARRLAG